MSITQATSSVLASNASLDNLNALATIAFTKAVTSSSTLNITGAVIFGNTLTVTNNIQSSAGNVSCASAGSLSVLGRSRIYSSSDGTFQFRNNANNADASLTAAGLTLTTTPLAASSGGTGKSSLGTGVANFLETPTSDNLRAALSDETGTGANVFADNPTIQSITINGTVTSNATSYVHTSASAAANRLSLGVANNWLYRDGPVPLFQLFEDFPVGGNGAQTGTHGWNQVGGSGSLNGVWGASTTSPQRAFGIQFYTTGATVGNFRGCSLGSLNATCIGMYIQACFCVNSISDTQVVVAFQGGGTQFSAVLDFGAAKLFYTTVGPNNIGSGDVITGLSLGVGDFVTGTRYRLMMYRISATQTEFYLASSPANSTVWTTIYPTGLDTGIVTHASHIGGWGQAIPLVNVSTTTTAAKTMYVDWITVGSPVTR